MNRHSTAFEAERVMPVGEPVKDLLLETHNKASTSEPPLPPAAIKKLNFRKVLMAGVAVAVLAGAAWYGWDYWTLGRYLVTTDDAYVKADNTTVAPKVYGYLREVLVGDNEQVKTGQVLARIDERDFKVALDQAKSDVAAANAAIVSRQAQLAVQNAVIDAARQPSMSTKRRSRSPRKRTNVTPISRPPAMAAYRTRSRHSRAAPARRPRSSATLPTLPPR